MQLAETVTFGASGLDRAAALRGQPDEIAARLRSGLILALWRGRVPVDAAGALIWAPIGSALLDHAKPPVFLGLDDGTARFAADISAWAPPAAVPQPAGIFSAEPQPHPALPEAAHQSFRACIQALQHYPDLLQSRTDCLGELIRG